MSYIVNPGAGPVGGPTSQANAEACMRQFVEDIKLAGVTYEFVNELLDGRYDFNLKRNDRTCEVSMPGVPVERVRYIDRDRQNITEFPRLYVEGSSWAWMYALNTARDYLTGESK